MAVMAAGFAGAVLLAGKVFMIDVWSLSPANWLMLAGMVLLAAGVMALLTVLLKKRISHRVAAQG